MVEKNRKNVSEYRRNIEKQQGKSGKAVDETLFQGRNVFVTVLFFGIASMFVLFFNQDVERDFIYWFTVGSYFFLSFYFFFMKRPYIRVLKNEIAIRRFGREKTTKAADIEKILIQPGYVIIDIKAKRNKLIFSRFFNRYDVEGIAQKLRVVADTHKIEYEVELK